MYLEPAGAPRPSLSGVLLGAHLGASGLGGLLPTDSGSIEASDVVGPGVAAGLDAAYRFGRRWCVGLSLEHANFGAGTEQSGAPSSAHASATLLAIILGVMVNPDKTSFYGEVGLACLCDAKSAGVDRDPQRGRVFARRRCLGPRGSLLPAASQGHIGSRNVRPKRRVTIG